MATATNLTMPRATVASPHRLVLLAAAAALLVGALASSPHAAAAPRPPAVCGGPDADNYLYCTSDAPTGPKYDFVDVSATGTKATMTGCGSWSDPMGITKYIPIGFDFRFYGRTFSQVHGSSSGLLLFDTARFEDCSPGYATYGIAMPGTWVSSATAPNWDVAPYWHNGGFGADSTDPSSGIYYDTQGEDGSRVFILQWHNVQTCITVSSFQCGSFSDPTWGYFGQGPNDFEVKLFEGTNVVETHTKDAKHAGGGTFYQTYGCSSLGIEGSGAQAGRKWHALAYVNIGAATFCQTTSFTPPTKWAIRYLQDAQPLAAFEMYSVPPNLYHNGRPLDDDVAQAGPEQDYVHPGNKVLFQDRSTDDDGPITKWSWDFGDGTSSTDRNPTHVYADASASYTVKLVVSDGYIDSKPATRTVGVLPNDAPKAYLSVAGQALAGIPLPFTDQSTDIDGKVTGWFWDFGDSSVSTAQNPQHSFPAAGHYRVRFTAYDDDGATDNATTDIVAYAQGSEVPPEAADTPRAEAGPDVTVAPGSLVALHGFETNGHAEVYRWSQPQGDRVALAEPATGTPSFTAPGLALGADGRAQPKTLVFSLVVSDKGRDSPPDQVTVTVAPPNSPPMLPHLPRLQVAPGDLVALEAAHARDADGDAIRFTWTQLSGPTVRLGGAGPADAAHPPTFAAPQVDEPTDLVFEVTASDRVSSSPPATLVVTVAPGAVGFTTAAGPEGLRFTATQLGSSYAWEFGDGASSTDAQPIHRYNVTGTYRVRLTAIDYDGQATTYSGDVHAYTASPQASTPNASARGSPAVPAAWLLLAVGLLGLLRRR